MIGFCTASVSGYFGLSLGLIGKNENLLDIRMKVGFQSFTYFGLFFPRGLINVFEMPVTTLELRDA